MNRVVALALSVLMVLSAIVAGTGAVAATSNNSAGQGSDIAGVQGDLAQVEETPNETNTTTENEPETTESESTTTTDGTTEGGGSEAPMDAGAKLAGVIGSQQAEHESAVQTRAFDKAFERAATNESRAAVVANSSAQIEEQIQVLENQSARLQDRYNNETLPKSVYHARLTVLTARVTALETRANQTSTRARSLPESALEKRGMNVSDARQLETRTRNVTSPQASAIAKRVAGPQVGQPTGPPATVPGREGDRGPPGTSNQSANAGNTSQNGPPSHSENRTRGPGNNTATNASAVQGPENSPANNASVRQGPENTTANNASISKNAIDDQNGHADHPSENENDMFPVNNAQNSAPFNETDVPRHANK